MNRVDLSASGSLVQSALFSRAPFNRGAHLQTMLLRKPDENDPVHLPVFGTSSLGDALLDALVGYTYGLCLHFSDMSSRVHNRFKKKKLSRHKIS